MAAIPIASTALSAPSSLPIHATALVSLPARVPATASAATPARATLRASVLGPAGAEWSCPKQWQSGSRPCGEVHGDRRREQQQQSERAERSGERGRRGQKEHGHGELTDREEQPDGRGQPLRHAERSNRLPAAFAVRELGRGGRHEHGGQQQP